MTPSKDQGTDIVDRVPRLEQLAEALDNIVPRTAAWDIVSNHLDAASYEMREAAAEITSLRAQLAAARADAWQPIETAPKDGTPIIVAGGVAYWRDDAWWTITGTAWPGERIQWPVVLWRPLGHPTVEENADAIRQAGGGE